MAERLRRLFPKEKKDVLSLNWMKSAIESLCETHTDIKTLITNLELPVTDWDERWIDVYLDISAKLLDISNCFISEITWLKQGHLLLQCVLHNLDSDRQEKFMRARSSLDAWGQHICTKNPRLENCQSILDSLVESLNMPKVKNSAKGKVLMRAMYGVKVETVFLCNIFAAALSGSSKNLLDLKILDTVLWAHAYTDLQASVNLEIKDKFSHGATTVLKELSSVDTVAKKLYPMIQDGFGPIEAEAFQISISHLRRVSEELSQGLDLLAKEVDGFFRILLAGRDALLCNLRASATILDPVQGANVEEQVVRS